MLFGWWFGKYILFFHSVGNFSPSQLTFTHIFQLGAVLPQAAGGCS
jgi:hypothetical protein